MQGGFIPDVILYLSYFYTKNELPIRLAWFWVSNYMSHLVGAFLATGILRLRAATGTAGWRYLFLIEGAFTLIVGLSSFILMPPGPTQTRTWYRKNGWFDERCVPLCPSLLFLILTPVNREEKIMVNRYVSSHNFCSYLSQLVCRILRDDPSKSDMHNRMGLTFKAIIGVLKDWRMWPIYILGFCFLSMYPFVATYVLELISPQ